MSRAPHRTRSTRRAFLRGAGGFALGLPFLRSLQPRSAWAGDPPFKPNPRFVCMATQHGGVWGRNLYPDAALLTGTTPIPGAHTIRHGTLVATENGSTSSLSPCLTAPSALLPPSRVAKMNVLRGLDIPFYISHHTGGHLGNYARNDGEYEGHSPVVTYRPTIDQIMAWSSKVYPDLSAIRRRSIHLGQGGSQSISWGWSNPSQGTGSVEAIPPDTSSLDLFYSIFDPDRAANERAPVVDKVLEAYARLRDGAFGEARRLSAGDRVKLDEHVERLYELERTLHATVSCSDVVPPTENADPFHPGYGAYTRDVSAMRQYYALFNEVIAAAFRCDTCRVVTLNSYEMWYPWTTDWHQDVAHLSHQPGEQAVMLEAQRNFFEAVFLDLCERLDTDEANGVTYLDNSLVLWTQESGTVTHDAYSVPTITAGSAAGFFLTGQYIDYRDEENLALLTYLDFPEQEEYRPGLLHGQWLATLLQAMGLDPADYERPGEVGYADPYTPPGTSAWPSVVRNMRGEVLPMLGASV